MTSKTKNRIAMIGSGAMATAVAKVAYNNKNNEVIIYGVDENEIKDLSKGMNTKYFPNSVKLPKFETTNNIAQAVKGATHIVLAVPSKVMDVVVANVLGSLTNEVVIVSVSKGFYPGTEKSLHEGIKDAAKGNKLVKGVVSLIGPSHAEEIVIDMPTIVAVVDKDKKLCQEIQQIFSTPTFKTYVQTDVKGAEVGAAYKNVLAIAAGFSAGMGYGINTLAALLTRGIAEMQKFNKAMGGKKETIMGLTGIGDLIVTATSDLSRNYTFGKQFAEQGKKALDTKATVEGLTALTHIYEIGKRKNLELPIVCLLHEMIYGKLKPQDCLMTLWNRGLKSE